MIPAPATLPELLRVIARLSEKRPVWLVGGAVRDLLLGRPVKDLDLVAPGPIRPFGVRLSHALGGAFFYLRQAQDTARILLRDDAPGAVRQLDLVALHGGTLDADLRRRDFTVNALGLDLLRLPSSLDPETLRRAVSDPTGGLADLAEGRVRRCSSNSLTDDPLRLMRAIRLAAALEWRVEAETWDQMRRLAPTLSRASTERVRDELFLMLSLSANGLERALTLLADADLLEEATRGPTLPNGVARALALEPWLEPGAWPEDLRAPLADDLEGCVTPPRDLRALLRYAALVLPAPDSDPVDLPGMEGLRSRLEFSTEEARLLRHIVLGALEALHRSSEAWSDSTRRFRTFQRRGDAVPGAMLLSMAASEPSEALRAHADDELRTWFHERERYLPAPLLDGRDLMSAFQRPGGPWLAELLDALREAQVNGAVTSRAEAETFAREWARAHEIPLPDEAAANPPSGDQA